MSWWSVLAVPVVGFVALVKGRGLFFWSVMAACFTFWPLLVLAFLPFKEIKPLQLPEPVLRFWGNRIIAKEMRKIETPSDLM